MLQNFVLSYVLWFGQFSLLFTYNNVNIYIDPFNLPKNIDKKADFVLITHSHSDHLSFDDLSLIADFNTKIYAPKDVTVKLKQKGYTNVTEVAPMNNFTIGNFAVQTFPMYNIVKTKFHPRSNNWVGYLITFDSIKVYVTGDIERMPELKNIETDIIFLPLGQTYTMNSVQEAVDAVVDTHAKLAIPVHYGMYEGTAEDAQKFCQLLNAQNIEGIIIKMIDN